MRQQRATRTAVQEDETRSLTSLREPHTFFSSLHRVSILRSRRAWRHSQFRSRWAPRSTSTPAPRRPRSVRSAGVEQALRDEKDEVSRIEMLQLPPGWTRTPTRASSASGSAPRTSTTRPSARRLLRPRLLLPTGHGPLRRHDRMREEALLRRVNRRRPRHQRRLAELTGASPPRRRRHRRRRVDGGGRERGGGGNVGGGVDSDVGRGGGGGRGGLFGGRAEAVGGVAGRSSGGGHLGDADEEADLGNAELATGWRRAAASSDARRARTDRLPPSEEAARRAPPPSPLAGEAPTPHRQGSAPRPSHPPPDTRRRSRATSALAEHLRTS